VKGPKTLLQLPCSHFPGRNFAENLQFAGLVVSRFPSTNEGSTAHTWNARAYQIFSGIRESGTGDTVHRCLEDMWICGECWEELLPISDSVYQDLTAIQMIDSASFFAVAQALAGTLPENLKLIPMKSLHPEAAVLMRNWSVSPPSRTWPRFKIHFLATRQKRLAWD